MPALTFSKWSPGGNTTLLFPDTGQRPAEQARLASLALDSSMLGGEQAGFVNLPQRKLRMAGGEFCVNASRAVGALLAYTAQYSGPNRECWTELPLAVNKKPKLLPQQNTLPALMKSRFPAGRLLYACAPAAPPRSGRWRLCCASLNIPLLL